MSLDCLNPQKFNGYTVPCGKCMPCRVRRVSDWQTRLCLELGVWPYASFVTLTYSDEHLPKSLTTGLGTLEKIDFQRFMKRLRKNSGLKLKYFACGEYGDVNRRPHYHAIIFGLDALNSKHRQYVIDSWQYCEPFMFAWKKYHNGIDVANEANIRYVAGYVQKKLYGKNAVAEYEKKGINPPFSLSSQGLGLEVFLPISKELRNSVTFPLKDKDVTSLDISELSLNLKYREKLFEIKTEKRTDCI